MNIINEFPSVTIWDMKIKDGQIVIATHGRGIWTADIPELDGFTAPEVTIAPRITKIGASLTELKINMTVKLRSEYEVSKVFMNGIEIQQIPANAVNDIEEITLNVPQAGTYNIQVISSKNGLDYYTEKKSILVSSPTNPVTSYFEDFEEVNSEEFMLSNFTINTPSGFSNNLLNTVHPYPAGNIFLTARLNQPIIVADENAFVKFKEVVHVEEGTPGALFGAVEFWDYVVVEGTTDGVDWTPLLEGYDAQSSSLWSGSSNSASSSQLVERTVNLLDTFNPNDIIVIRFRLFSDAAVTAWGWGIDDLEIQTEDQDNDGYNSFIDCDDTNPDINPGVEDIPNNGIDEDCNGEDKLVSGIVSIKNNKNIIVYPNPVYNLLYISTTDELMAFDVYTIDGLKVKKTSISKNILDVSQLAPGAYILKIETNEGIFSQKIIKN